MQQQQQQLKKQQQQQLKKLQQQQKKQQQGGNANKGGSVRCIGGSVVGGGCQCAQGKRMVQAGANVFRCVKDN